MTDQNANVVKSGVTDQNPIVVKHRRCGEMSINAEDVLEISEIAGFPQLRRFVLVEHGTRSPFAWLASLDDTSLAFAVTDPTLFFPTYRPQWKRDRLSGLGIESAADAAVLVVVTAREEGITANLAAPIVVATAQRCGIQTILDGEWPIAEPIQQSRPDDESPAWRQIESKPHK